jgi:hypothetical protein
MQYLRSIYCRDLERCDFRGGVYDRALARIFFRLSKFDLHTKRPGHIRRASTRPAKLLQEINHRTTFWEFCNKKLNPD